METYPEDQIRDWLSLYSDPPASTLTVQDAIEDFEYYLSDDYQRSPDGSITPLGAVDVAARTGQVCLSHFAYWILQSGDVRSDDLDLAQRLRFLGDRARLAQFEGNPNHLTPRLAEYGETLLQLLATGRTALVAPTERIALSVLQSGRYAAPEGSSGYFSAPAKIGVFALEMLAATRNETIEWETFHVPADRFWLDCARIGVTEPDPDKGADWARALCDAHMAALQSDLENGSMNAAPGQEIQQAAHFLWPITVFAFLRLRARLGFATAEIDHPLMRTSFAALRDWDVPVGRAITIAPWYAGILDKVETATPELSDALTVIR